MNWSVCGKAGEYPGKNDLSAPCLVWAAFGFALFSFGAGSEAQAQTETARLASAPVADFVEPELRRSRAGILDTTLSVVLATTEIGGELRQHRSYEGALTGPTLRVKPGDRLMIKLINRLPKDDETCPDDHDHNGTHCVNTTNLHTHGLHVSPTGNSDNVLLTIKPGETVDYDVAIPEDHPAGTFWYHAHKHGSVAAQLREGMAGALIIEGDIDDLPEIKAARERLLVFQQLRVPYDDEDGQQPTTVNGVTVPLMTARPGEVQRWRLVHAGISETLNMQLRKCDGPQDAACNGPVQAIHQIAADGITIGKLHTPTDSYNGPKTLQNTLLMQPGYRADILVKLEAGDYALVKNARSAKASLLGAEEASQFLARISVSGDPKPMALPTNEALAGLAPFDPVSDAEVTNLDKPRKLTFNVNGKFNDIDGKKFMPGRVDQELKLGDVEEWHLGSDRAPHPFHIHVNPFQIIGGDKDNPGFWKDTVIVRDDEDIKIRTRYEVFTGLFVLHCHILTHEDAGMMQLVDIVP